MEPRYDARDGRRGGRSRSRSPRDHRDGRDRRSRRDPDERRRERTSERPSERRERRHRSRERRREPKDELPFGARKLSKGDFEAFRPLLAYYLRVQKQRDIRAMEEREVKGRWKSFLGKWNGGELAEGWYDAHIWEIAVGEAESAEAERPESPREERQASERREESTAREVESESGGDDDDDDEDDIGAPLPPGHRSGARHGAAAPHLQDLRLRDELQQEDSLQETSDRVSSIRHARRLDRRDQKERLEELAPRADPGSRERKLEKRADVNAKMREFREPSPGGEADEGTLMGAGEGESLTQMKKEEEARMKRKSEREARREEIWRARMAEREERVKEYREREEGTVAMLRELARNSGRAL